ncbi:SDR family NAD(P)-dependent oxidoreductase [Acrocarpospora catenulata]|uniref:SDR family NAD(P)-dependent oxidoreductase n=1 Tax=Acrocarpospora catenulata TaxID=2836182 RepID=UPI001BD9507D|nr:SDR family NAD(P)-dependent oxidoreductase [Acrocarpospora catenulata]
MSVPLPDLTGRVAVVTGASRGIGRSIATTLAGHGATVVLAARTKDSGSGAFEGGIADAAAEIEAAGGRALPLVTDLTDAAGRERLVSTTVAEFGRLDILVNNAAVTFFGAIDEMPMKRYDLMFEVQVKAAYHLMHLAIPHMKEQGEGWILNISSIASEHPGVPPRTWTDELPGTVYGMCKAALERASTGAAAELFRHNIAVNSLAPNRVVPTPGTVFHGLVDSRGEDVEDPGLMPAAALLLCSGPPRELTGRTARSADLLAELGALPASR